MKWYTGQKVHAKANRYRQLPWYEIFQINFWEDGEAHGWEVYLLSPYGHLVDLVDIEDLFPLQEPSDLLSELL